MELGILLFVVFLIALVIAFSFKSDEDIKSESEEHIDKEVTYKKESISGRKNHVIKKVHYVIDGDTIIVGDAWNKFKVRLYAIDCPEDGQPWGDTAKFGLIRLIGGRKIRIESHGYDKYERMLATVYVKNNSDNEWINVNAKMVVCGHAWVMRRFYKHLPKDRQNDLNSKESWAKSKKVGLWKTENPTPPWKWRGNSNND